MLEPWAAPPLGSLEHRTPYERRIPAEGCARPIRFERMLRPYDTSTGGGLLHQVLNNDFPLRTAVNLNRFHASRLVEGQRDCGNRIETVAGPSRWPPPS